MKARCLFCLLLAFFLEGGVGHTTDNELDVIRAEARLLPAPPGKTSGTLDIGPLRKIFAVAGASTQNQTRLEALKIGAPYACTVFGKGESALPLITDLAVGKKKSESVQNRAIDVMIPCIKNHSRYARQALASILKIADSSSYPSVKRRENETIRIVGVDHYFLDK